METPLCKVCSALPPQKPPSPQPPLNHSNNNNYASKNIIKQRNNDDYVRNLYQQQQKELRRLSKSHLNKGGKSSASEDSVDLDNMPPIEFNNKLIHYKEFHEEVLHKWK
eukprot:CAMPEP_0114696872 /NCGR_PEP_ID=MMETSP0191-20121206/73091_1 /TAXON_ID=126664 /ORGANISM="Sorites sp." /LENGTH=108 /DNA_ID=CAMNT_0001995147 /DNA_START=56 /DNA_END=385 /DNA_ORIENTATION=+